MSGSTRQRRRAQPAQVYNRLLHCSARTACDTARQNIAEHYDLGNDFYRLWLDPTMTYSAAKFSSPDQSLEEAQIGKYEALCRSWAQADGSCPGDRKRLGRHGEYAAKNYGCRVTTVTISQRAVRIRAASASSARA